MASHASTHAPQSGICFTAEFAANVPAYLSRIRRHRFSRWGRQFGLQADLEQLTLVELARIATRSGTLPASNDPHFGVILTQRLSNSIRKLKREHRDIVGDGDNEFLSLDDDGIGEELGARLVIDEAGPDVVLEAVKRNQAVAALRSAIKALTPRQREVIERVSADMREAEIAVELGVSVQAVSKVKFAAIAKLKQLVPAEHAIR